MKKDTNTKTDGKKKLVLRKQSIRTIDDTDLVHVAGGGDVPPDAGCSKGNL